MRPTSFTLLVALCNLVAAYPADISHGLVARDCSAEVTAFNVERRQKRGLTKRTFYPNIQNLTCIISPETPRADYVANSAIRQDVTDGQAGVPFTLDIGVLDITNCKPLQNAMVELWSPNSQGDYGATFLRGSFPTTSAGIVEFQTIFPGFNSDGANHINLLVHPGDSLSSAVAHVGQVFFTDQWTNIIGMSTPYNTNTHTRILNSKDTAFVTASGEGYSPIIDIEEIHDDWPEGIIGYITVGVDPSKTF